MMTTVRVRRLLAATTCTVTAGMMAMRAILAVRQRVHILRLQKKFTATYLKTYNEHGMARCNQPERCEIPWPIHPACETASSFGYCKGIFRPLQGATNDHIGNDTRG